MRRPVGPSRHQADCGIAPARETNRAVARRYRLSRPFCLDVVGHGLPGDPVDAKDRLSRRRLVSANVVGRLTRCDETALGVTQAHRSTNEQGHRCAPGPPILTARRMFRATHGARCKVQW